MLIMACLVAPTWGKGNLSHDDANGAFGLSRGYCRSRWSTPKSKPLLDALGGPEIECKTIGVPFIDAFAAEAWKIGGAQAHRTLSPDAI